MRWRGKVVADLSRAFLSSNGAVKHAQVAVAKPDPAAGARNRCRSLRELAVTGRDLTGLGIPAGPELGAMLAELLEAVIAGEAENTRPALLERVMQKERSRDGQADGTAGPGDGAGA